jgi:mRNA-degrading endonuclease RelE of RelBE toxin-antitoxin system
MRLFQMPRFKRYVKKLPQQFQQVILDAVEEVLADPEAG